VDVGVRRPVSRGGDDVWAWGACMANGVDMDQSVGSTLDNHTRIPWCRKTVHWYCAHVAFWCVPDVSTAILLIPCDQWLTCSKTGFST